MPKRKPDKVIVHRIELQEHERDALDMMSASYTARNITASVGNLITPVLSASAAGVAAALGLLAFYEIYTQEKGPNYGSQLLGMFTPWGEKKLDTPEKIAEAETKHQTFLNRLSLLRVSITQQLENIRQTDSI